jgi:hypothetical protein
MYFCFYSLLSFSPLDQQNLRRPIVSLEKENKDNTSDEYWLRTRKTVLKFCTILVLGESSYELTMYKKIEKGERLITLVIFFMPCIVIRGGSTVV